MILYTAENATQVALDAIQCLGHTINHGPSFTNITQVATDTLTNIALDASCAMQSSMKLGLVPAKCEDRSLESHSTKCFSSKLALQSSIINAKEKNQSLGLQNASRERCDLSLTSLGFDVDFLRVFLFLVLLRALTDVRLMA